MRKTLKKADDRSGSQQLDLITTGQVLGAYLEARDDPTKFERARSRERAYQKQLDGTIRSLAQSLGLPSPVDADATEQIGAYRELLFAVAKEYVPGLKRTKKGGRPQKWDFNAKWLLVADIERNGGNDSIVNVSRAAAVLAGKWFWREFVEEKDGTLGSSAADTIRTAYNTFRKEDASAARFFIDSWREVPEGKWNPYVEEQIAEKLLERRYGENCRPIYFGEMADYMKKKNNGS